MKSLVLSEHSQACRSSSILHPLLMYCTLHGKLHHLSHHDKLVWFAVSIPELVFPRWDAFRSGNAISSFSGTCHYYFATPQSPNNTFLTQTNVNVLLQTLYQSILHHLPKKSIMVARFRIIAIDLLNSS